MKPFYIKVIRLLKTRLKLVIYSVCIFSAWLSIKCYGFDHLTCFGLTRALKKILLFVPPDRNMTSAVLQTARNLCVVVTIQALQTWAGGRLGTGELMESVTCLFGQWRTFWKMLPKLGHGTGCTGLETYQHTMCGHRPGSSSCQSLLSSPDSSTSKLALSLTDFFWYVLL